MECHNSEANVAVLFKRIDASTLLSLAQAVKCLHASTASKFAVAAATVPIT